MLDPLAYKSKYYSVCGLSGGDGMGRGSFGQNTPFNICKYFMENGNEHAVGSIATPGLGGEIAHYSPEKNNIGFGGGVYVPKIDSVRFAIFFIGKPWWHRASRE